MLLDTHVLLWYVNNSPELPRDIAGFIQESGSAYVSAASIWEISIKAALGKLKVSGVPVPGYGAVAKILQECLEIPFELMPITADQCALAGFIRCAQRDPFDRMLAVQSVLSRNPLVSADPVFDTMIVVKGRVRSRVTRIWTPVRRGVRSGV